MLEDPEIFCDNCGQIMKHRITGGAAVHFHGIGWTTSGSKDGTASHGIHTTETTMAIPAMMDKTVTNQAKKAATKITKQIGTGE